MGFQGLDAGRNGDAMLGGIEVLTCKERIEIIRPTGRLVRKLQSVLFSNRNEPCNILATFDDVRQVLRISKSGEAVTEIQYSTINYTEMHGSHDLHIKHDGGVLPLAALYSRSQGRKVLTKLRQATMVPVII